MDFHEKSPSLFSGLCEALLNIAVMIVFTAIWIVLALALGFLPRVGLMGQAALVTLAAAVASATGSIITFGPVSFLTSGHGLISVVAIGLSAAGFVSVVAIGCFGAAVFMRARGAAGPRAAASALVTNWFSIYLHFSATPPSPSERDADAYVQSAAVAVIVPIVSLVIAIVVKSRALIILATVLLIGWVLVAGIFVVPQNRLAAGPESPTPTNSTHHPCYSGSNDCEGG